MQLIRGILFDKDGTLFDFERSWSAWAAGILAELAGGDMPRAEVLGRRIGFDMSAKRFDPGSPAIAGTPAETAALLLPILGGWDGTSLIARLNEAAASAPMYEAAPLVPLIAELRDMGMALGVATNDAEAAALEHLRVAGLGDGFDYVAGYDSGHGAKPAPGMCLAFAEEIGLPPSEIAMVGDSVHDLEAGRSAGMKTVAVLTGVAGAEELAPLADAILKDVGGLPGWLDGRACG